MPPYRKTSTELRTRAVVLVEMEVRCREVKPAAKGKCKNSVWHKEAPGRDSVSGRQTAEWKAE